MGKAVFKIAMIVLIWLRVNDNRVVDSHFFYELQVRLQRRWRGLIRCVRMIRKALRIEQMNVRIDQRTFAGSGGACGGCRSEKLSSVHRRGLFHIERQPLNAEADTAH